MTLNKTKEISTLIDRAAKAEKSEDALRFSQAAANVANALIGFKNSHTPTPNS